MDYDGSDTSKDQVKGITITLNEKLATLKALEESTLAVIDESFSYAVHGNALLTNADKFSYLRSLFYMSQL